jgi:hypothetical protein
LFRPVDGGGLTRDFAFLSIHGLPRRFTCRPPAVPCSRPRDCGGIFRWPGAVAVMVVRSLEGRAGE